MRQRSIIMGSVLALIAGCSEFGADYEPLLDGAPGPTHATDLRACQDRARAEPFTTEIAGAAVAGALFGGLWADHEDVATAPEGIALGLVAGVLGASFEAAEYREEIIVNCMRGRGHRVLR